MKIYHSALNEELNIDKEIMMCKNNGSEVHKHDICHGLPSYYDKCDVLYSEPAWLDGFQKFMHRAESEGVYDEYLKAISDIISESKKPTWLIIGKHAHKKIPKPHRVEPIKIHNYWTTMLCWNDENEYSANTNYDFIEQISEKYQCVGDFCCGYGNTGKAFLNKGKQFVMSDINGKCVYHIAKELLGYEDSNT
jgi:hypothetical protein